jgi:hypothetical protein
MKTKAKDPPFFFKISAVLSLSSPRRVDENTHELEKLAMAGPLKCRSRRYERAALIMYQIRPNPNTMGTALIVKSLGAPILAQCFAMQTTILATLDDLD